MCNEVKFEADAAGLAEQDAGLLARLVHASPAVLYSCKVAEDYGTIAVTENVQRLLGYAPADFVGDPSFWAMRIHPEDSARVFEEMPKLFREGEQLIEYRFRHAGGHYVWLRDQMKLERDEDGRPTRLLGCWLVIACENSDTFIARVINESPERTTTITAGRIYAKQTRTPTL
jgi:PAS domain-containing protein